MVAGTDDSGRFARWSVEQRLGLLLARLQWEGRVNRSDLVQRFGISPNQATADLKRFGEIYPGAMVYDPREKTYRAGPHLPAVTPADAVHLLRDLRLVAEGVVPQDGVSLAFVPVVAVADTPPRPVGSGVLRAVLAAIRTRASMRAKYLSFSHPEPQPRHIEPHALVFDGFRWHARCRDRVDGAYKDFVLGRLADCRVCDPDTAEALNDHEWSTIVELDIRPHPGLTPLQRRVIETDYGMRGGRLRVTCRSATLFYTKRRLGLTTDHEQRAASEQHIILESERIFGGL